MYETGAFDAVYNSKNIKEAFGTKPELLVYAGLRAEKYLANNAPEKDMELIFQAEDNIEKINPKKLVLISTIDVFKVPKGVDESSLIDTENLHAYGYNRYMLEIWAREHFPDALIIRLPGLFGKNIKKNFIYDYINIIPFMLKKEKYDELSRIDFTISAHYTLQDNGFYQVNEPPHDEKEELKKKFKKAGFSALNFTDSRSVFQFYDLRRLWADMKKALEAGITLWHPATEPVSAGEIYKYLTGDEFVNELNGMPADYDFRTCHNGIYEGKAGYICSKEEVLAGIKAFVEGRNI